MVAFIWSLGALFTGVLLDILFGDPENFPHIVRLMGWFIAQLDKHLPHTVRGGALLVLFVTVVFTGVPIVLLFICYRYLPLLGYLVESFLCYQLLAAKSLQTQSMKVYHRLREGDVEGARKNVSMIVGRDTSALDRDGIICATVETVAENTSDGVIAPLLYIMLGGAALGCFYKAVNTMDSMVGYKNDRYIHFGRLAAKIDDFLNYVPSRLSALLMIAAAYILDFDGKNALHIWRRDRRKHVSPNSAQTEAVCAGALQVRLAGPAVYHGVMHDKPYIGDKTRPIENEDIVRANHLMYIAVALVFIIVVLFRVVCLGVSYFGKI